MYLWKIPSPCWSVASATVTSEQWAVTWTIDKWQVKGEEGSMSYSIFIAHSCLMIWFDLIWSDVQANAMFRCNMIIIIMFKAIASAVAWTKNMAVRSFWPVWSERRYSCSIHVPSMFHHLDLWSLIFDLWSLIVGPSSPSPSPTSNLERPNSNLQPPRPEWRRKEGFDLLALAFCERIKSVA